MEIRRRDPVEIVPGGFCLMSCQFFGLKKMSESEISDDAQATFGTLASLELPGVELLSKESDPELLGTNID